MARGQGRPPVKPGTVNPPIHKTFPLADAAAAHTPMERGAHIGKIVLICEQAGRSAGGATSCFETVARQPPQHGDLCTERDL